MEKRSSSSSEETEVSESTSSSGASSAPRTKSCSFRSRSRGEGDECCGGAWTHAGGGSEGCCKDSKAEMEARMSAQSSVMSLGALQPWRDPLSGVGEGMQGGSAQIEKEP
jgi:hypothetical protein